MKFFTRILNPYPLILLISWDKDYNEFEHCLKKLVVESELYKINGFSGNDYGAKTNIIGNIIVVRFLQINHNHIAHEISHVLFYLFNEFDIPFGNDTAEVYAYTQGYLTEEIYKEFKKRKLI